MPLWGARIGLATVRFDPFRGASASASTAKGFRCFAHPNLLGWAGQVPVRRLSERAGLLDLLTQHLSGRMSRVPWSSSR